jgi:hypothetical protein
VTSLVRKLIGSQAACSYSWIKPPSRSCGVAAVPVALAAGPAFPLPAQVDEVRAPDAADAGCNGAYYRATAKRSGHTANPVSEPHAPPSPAQHERSLPAQMSVRSRSAGRESRNSLFGTHTPTARTGSVHLTLDAALGRPQPRLLPARGLLLRLRLPRLACLAWRRILLRPLR